MRVLLFLVEYRYKAGKEEEMHYIRVFWFVFLAVLVGDIVGNVSLLLSHPVLPLGSLQVDSFWLIVFLNAIALGILALVAAAFMKAEKIAIEFEVGHHMVDE